MKKLPERTCIGCNMKKSKNEMIRIVKNKNRQVFIDTSGKEKGRGTYICKNQECLEKVIKNKRLTKVLEMNFLEEIYKNISNIINGGEIIG